MTGERLTEVTCLGWGDDDPSHKNNAYKNPFWNETGALQDQSRQRHAHRNVRKGAVNGAERAQYHGDKMSFYFPNPLGVGADDRARRQADRRRTTADSSRQSSKAEPYEQPQWWKTDLLPEPLRHDSGHSGSHTFLTHEFIDALIKNRKPAVDVYEAVAYTAPGIVAHQSALKGGERLKIPSFDA